MVRKMKIVFINIYQNKVYRGSETFVYELSRRLSKKYEVDVLTSLDLAKIWKKKYDVIIPTNGRIQAILVRLITWLYGGKMVISGQSGIGFDDRLNLYTFPDYFIALSDFQLRWAKKINPFVKIVKIPNGVDFKKFNKFKRERSGSKILSVGALERNKRHDLTIRAVAKIDNARLTIAGKGSEEENLRNLGRRLIGERFDIVSFPHSEINKVYKDFDVFAFPTVPWESFGIVILEAMAAGLPVVANNDAIRREIVGEAGILVDPTDINEYAKALKTALEADWGNKPVNQAKKFDWDIIAGEYKQLLSTVK